MDCTMWSLCLMSLLLTLVAPILCQDEPAEPAAAAANGNGNENGRVVNVFTTPTDPPSTTLPDDIPTTTPHFVLRNFTNAVTDLVIAIIPTKPVDESVVQPENTDGILVTNPPTKVPGKGSGGDGGDNKIDSGTKPKPSPERPTSVNNNNDSKPNGASPILLDNVFLAVTISLGVCLRLWTSL